MTSTFSFLFRTRWMMTSLILGGVVTVSAACEAAPAADTCCACLADNICILSEDEATCASDLAAGENPDSTERPFGEGIGLNVDCAETQCADCVSATLAAGE